MNIKEYTKEPCPICDHAGWCGRREDGLVLCKRPPNPPQVAGYIYKGLAKDGQTAMYVAAGREHRGRAIPPPARVERPSVSSATLNETHTTPVAALTPELRCALAAELGLPEAILSELNIGWSENARHHAVNDLSGAYIFPEYNGQGRLIGLSYRFPADKVAHLIDTDGKSIGNKSTPSGLRRGLTLPLGWKDMPDPVLIVEGPSDVLAGRAVGLSVIGRPSNCGGVEFIAQLSRNRQVIVLAENDRKPDGLWPGKEGAELVVRHLETTWGRPVPVAFPTEGIKDLRDWVRQLVTDWATVDVVAIRDTILDTIKPPDLLLLARSRDRRGRVTVKVFRRDDGVEAVPIHSDRLHIEEAAARKRFAKAVAKAEPDTDLNDLQRRLLALKVPTPGIQKPVVSQKPPAQQHVITNDPDGSTVDDQLPTVFLPGGPMPITQSALMLGSLLAKTNKYYNRSGTVTTVGKDKDNRPIIETLKPAALASVFEAVAKTMKYIKEKGQFVPQEAISSEQDAKLIQHCRAFQELLPPIFLLSRCPVLIERDSQLVQVSGYDRDSGILAFGEPAAEVLLEDAVTLLSEMLADFHFASLADRARALAALITPALVFGELLNGRAPVDLGETDASQSGKGYRAKLTAAVYGHIVKTVTQKKGGVGSMEESFATALIQGYNFISFDNVRKAVDSPALESFLTEDNFLARVPHLAAVEIDPHRVIVQFTSNKAEITADLANRSSCVRILKQPEDYRFQQYAEGDILEHVRANQPLYLGAVFAAVKTWHQAGMPRSDATGHDFRPWAGALDWIAQNILGTGPLLEGHRQTQVRMSTPHLNWLRDVALAVRNNQQLGQWLRASDLAEIISDVPDLELPGLPKDGDLTDKEVRKKVLQAIGRRMSQCFGADSIRMLDGFEIQRQETEDKERGRVHKKYCFSLVETSPYAQQAHRGSIEGTIGGTGQQSLSSGPGDGAGVGQTEVSPLCASDFPPMHPPIETAFSPISPYSPYGSVIAPRENQKIRVLKNMREICPGNKNLTEPIGGIGGKPIYNPDEDEVLI